MISLARLATGIEGSVTPGIQEVVRPAPERDELAAAEGIAGAEEGSDLGADIRRAHERGPVAGLRPPQALSRPPARLGVGGAIPSRLAMYSSQIGPLE